MSYYRIFFKVTDQGGIQKDKQVNIGDDTTPSTLEEATTAYAELVKDPAITSDIDKILKIN